MNIDPTTHIAKDARILIVDDEKRNVETLGEILSRAGYAICISMTDPRKAVEKFEEMRPDLVLLDWHTGEFSGLEVLRQIRATVAEEAIPPILVLTADDSPSTKREALAAGVSDFLSKPLDYSEVLLRIRNLLMLRMLYLRDQGVKQRLEDEVTEKTAELERALEELRESQHQAIQPERLRALGSMAGGIAHDFNNVITVIQGYAEMFLEPGKIEQDSAGALEAFRVITRASEDSAEIVRRLREFYRPYRKGEDDRRALDVREIAEEAVQLSVPRWKTQTQAQGIYIDVKMELGNAPVMHGAASELREVLMNLIFNAVDAMPGGGQIVVRTGEEEGRVFFEVEDNGVGMNEETRRHCLEPFFTTKGQLGTGLGLATTYGIVRRHGGIIRIDSQTGMGSRFTVLLPVGEAAPAKENAKASKESWARVRATPHIESLLKRVAPHSLRVLVVDDQPDICQVLRHYLEGDSHQVETASNGREALEKFRDQRFDLVITDRAMPKMNGDQLASAIKGIRPGEPVILLTAFTEQPAQISPDVDVTLSKPMSLQKIREAIQQVVAA